MYPQKQKCKDNKVGGLLGTISINDNFQEENVAFKMAVTFKNKMADICLNVSSTIQHVALRFL